MKKSVSMFLACVFLVCATFIPGFSWAQAGGCEAKQRSIEQEIAYAQAHGNKSRVAGLQTALAKLKANCTDASLREARQRKVSEAQEKLAEREQALREAQADGKSASKIAERQRKVDEAHAALERAQIEAGR